MKKSVVVLLIALVIVLQLVSAQGKTFLKLKESIVVSGKNITFVGLLSRGTSEEVNFLVDGVFGTVEKFEEDDVNGVLINITGISKNPPVIILYVRVLFSCGDGVCSAKEDYEICCKDCGCGLGERQACINNICRENISHYSAEYECYKDLDCDDNVTCTKDRCNTRDIPHVCFHEQIDTCTAGDNCCPKTCDDDEDVDCKTVNRCMSKGECDDDNACTTDACEGAPRRCKYTTQNGCPLGKECIAIGTVNRGTYCSEEKMWINLKGVNKACSNDYECIAGSCKYGKCGGLSFLTSALAGNIYMKIAYIAGIMTFTTIIIYVLVTRKKIRSPKQPQPVQGSP